MTQPMDPRRSLRADAARNEDRLLAAAVRLRLGEGEQIPLEQVAAAAGVGVGTLYRRFPNRAALLEALQVRAYRILIAEAETADQEGASGLDAVAQFLTRSFEWRDEFVLPLHGAPRSEDSESAALRERLKVVLTTILRRGHEDGSVRPEVTAWHVVRFGAMLAQPMPEVRGWAEAAAAQRSIFLRGIAARDDTEHTGECRAAVETERPTLERGIGGIPPLL